MNTKNAISTVSYNTEGFLLDKLDRLVRTKKIEYYIIVHHIGELNEVGVIEKDHTHVYLCPNGKINTMDLGEEFIEFTKDNPKPLKCIQWRSSKIDDWILYNSHDPMYLLSKFETRQYQYSYEEFITSDENQFARDWVCAFQSSGYAKNKNFYNYCKNGGTLAELMKAGAVSPNQVGYYNEFIEAVKKSTDVLEKTEFVKEIIKRELKNEKE